MTIKEKFFEKIAEMQSSPKTIIKTFRFTIENLQDNQNEALNEVLKYLEDNSKILDYHLHQNIDENTFSPLLEMHIIPIESISVHLENFTWEDSFAMNKKHSISKIRKDLDNILSNYLFEYNDSATRNSMCRELGEYFLSIDEHPEFLDRTPLNDIEQGRCKLMIKDEFYTKWEMSIDEYLNMLYGTGKFSK